MYKLSLLSCLFATLITHVSSAVYESRNSDDVDFFMEHNPETVAALLFYNFDDEQKNPEIKKNIDKVLSIFKNIGEDGRSTDEWVNDLNDRVHLMRVDVTLNDNSRTTKEYKVGHTPLVVLMEHGRTMFEELVDTETYDHIKEVFESEQKKKDAAKAPPASTGTTAPSSGSATPSGSASPSTGSTQPSSNAGTQGSSTPSGSTSSTDSKGDQETIEAAKRAQKAAEDAKKAADEAVKALEQARETFEQHMKLEHARREAEDAKKIAEKAQKDLNEAKKKIEDHLAGDKKINGTETDSDKCPSGDSAAAQKNQNAGQLPGQGQGQNALQPPPGYTIEYIPVVKAYQTPPTQSQKSPSTYTYQQPSSTTYSQPSTSTRTSYTASSTPSSSYKGSSAGTQTIGTQPTSSQSSGTQASGTKSNWRRVY